MTAYAEAAGLSVITGSGRLFDQPPSIVPCTAWCDQTFLPLGSSATAIGQPEIRQTVSFLLVNLR